MADKSEMEALAAKAEKRAKKARKAAKQARKQAQAAAAEPGAEDRPKPSRIPKEIGGVKIPKSIRKRGEAAIEMAKSQHGRELIATGLIAAGTAIAAKAMSKAVGKRGTQTPHLANQAKGQTPEQMGEAIAAMVTAKIGDALGKIAAKTKKRD